MARIWFIILLVLAGCNVANEPPPVSGVSGSGGTTSTQTTISFTSGSFNRIESALLATITYSLNQPLDEDLDITFLMSGTATGGAVCGAGVDYVTPAPTDINAGVLNGVVNITLCNDAVFEGNETLNIAFNTLTPSIGLGTHGTTTLTIIESLAAPKVTFTAASSGSIPEGAFPVNTVTTVNLQLGYATTVPVDVNINYGGSATYGTDYTLSATSVTFAPGVTAASVDVTILGDDLIEPNETITLSLAAPTNAGIGLQPTHDLQIAQDEVPSTIQAAMNLATDTVLESAGTVNVQVDLTGATDHATILRYTVDFAGAITATQRARYPQDFILTGQASSSGFISVPAGAVSVNIPVTIKEDTLYEPTEGIRLTLLGGPEISAVGGSETTELIIDTNDAAFMPRISFTLAAQSMAESNSPGGAIIRMVDPANAALDKASGEDVVVTLTTNDQTTEGNGVDWEMDAMPLAVTIPAGTTRVTVPISVYQDGVDEDNEYFDVTLTPPGAYVTGANATQRVTIVDADAAPRVSFSVATSSTPETGMPATVDLVFRVDAPSEKTITVNFSNTGTATLAAACGAGVDLAHATSGVVTIPAGTSLHTETLDLCDDVMYEGDETGVFTITSAVNANATTPTQHTMSVVDDELVPPDLEIVASDVIPDENDGSVTLTVNVTNGVTAQAAMVVPVTFAGTAVKGTHYNYAGTAFITIASGAASGSKVLSITDNALYGGDRTISATISTGFWSVSDPNEVVTIVENEAVPEIGFSTAAQTFAESAGAVTSTIQIGAGFAACEGPVSVTLTRGGTSTYGSDDDFQFPTAGLSAAATSTTLSYNIINDLVYEPGASETIIATITAATCNGNALVLNPAVQTITITDDDPMPTLGYSVSTRTVSESTTSVTINFSMDRPSSQAVSFTSDLVANVPAPADLTDPDDPEFYEATVPGDASVGITAVNIAAGATTATQTVTINNDGNYEYSETATMQISGVVGATLSPTNDDMALVITDNDTAPYVHLSFVNDPLAMSSAASVAEDSGTVTTITALLSNTAGNGGTAYTASVPVEIPVTLSGTAAAVTGGSYTQDYTLTVLSTTGGTLVVPAGSSTTTFNATPVNDATYEDNETAIFTIGTPVNALRSTSFATPTLTFTADADAQPTATITHTYTDPLPEADSSASFVVTVGAVGKTVTISYTIDTGVANAVTSADHDLVNGTLTVNPSTTPQTIPITFDIIDDLVAEGVEDLKVDIAGADTNETIPTATIQIAISDPLLISAGATHACGVMNGSVKCWGEGRLLGRENTSNYGGAGEAVSALSAIDLGTGFLADKVVVGRAHACALSRTGVVKCWGNNEYGQLGIDRAGTGVDQYIGDAAGEMGNTLQSVSVGMTVADLVAGDDHTCAITTTGLLKCWGSNDYGQLGLVKAGVGCSAATNTACYGDHSNEVSSMGYVAFPVGGSVTKVAAGSHHTCALLSTNQVYCFGQNDQGQLGRNDNAVSHGGVAGDMTNVTTFLPVGFHSNFSSLEVRDVSASTKSSCAVVANGATEEVVCWGDNANGGLGQGHDDFDIGLTANPLTAVSAPVDLDAFGGNFATISGARVGDRTACARGEDGDVICWGRGIEGQLGNNNNNSVGDGNFGAALSADGDGLLVAGTYQEVSPGQGFTCFVVGHDQYRCLGTNTSLQLGMQSNGASIINPATAAESF